MVIPQPRADRAILSVCRSRRTFALRPVAIQDAKKGKDYMALVKSIYTELYRITLAVSLSDTQ
jgi:hypothetical protein